MEYYFPEDTNISLFAEASTAIINKQTITNFPSYKKQLVQINQQTKDTPDYLFFTIRGSGTTATNPEGYLVFYGVKEWVDTVPSEIYDHVLETGMFEYDNGNMKMHNDIDMNNHKIKNNPLPTNPTDLLTKESLITNDIYVSGAITTEKIFHKSVFLFYIYGSRVNLMNPFINFIILNVDTIFYNRQDQLSILMTSSISRFSFTTSASGYVKIIINRQFNGHTNKIFTNIISNATFVIFYRPITFKTN